MRLLVKCMRACTGMYAGVYVYMYVCKYVRMYYHPVCMYVCIDTHSYIYHTYITLHNVLRIHSQVDVLMIPMPTNPKEVIVVLTWSAKPTDLDLWIITEDGERATW